MATTPFDFLLSDFGNWQPNAPTPSESNPFEVPDWNLPDYGLQPPTDNVSDPATTPGNIDFWGGDGGVASQNWASAMLPLMQLLSNNRQFQAEFGEGRDMFNMNLAGRQQSAQEDQARATQQNFESQFTETQLNNQVSRDVATGNLDLAQENQATQADQWAQSFAAQGINDQHARTLADQRLAFEEDRSNQQLEQAEREQIWQEEYGRASLALQERTANFQTFGRSQAPARWSANWG